jgi:hypothetical protein
VTVRRNRVAYVKLDCFKFRLPDLKPQGSCLDDHNYLHFADFCREIDVEE